MKYIKSRREFIQHLVAGEEFFFQYNNATIDIAHHIKNGKKVFEFNINGYEEGEDISKRSRRLNKRGFTNIS